MTGECPPAFPISTVAIVPERLRAEQGGFRLSIIEPMDEAVHLDHLKLDVVDRPPGVSTTTDERFTPTGPRPTGQVLAWREVIRPARAAHDDYQREFQTRPAGGVEQRPV